ncbi:MAG: hypothetical protein KF747_16435 [Nitrospira sp.]|nr:hypothetical protein [Nitrospira sp.]
MDMKKLGAGLLAIVTVLCSDASSFAIEKDHLSQAMRLWEQYAPFCAAADGSTAPSKESCDDGDTTLFNGLLCAAGDARGCDAVRRAQDPETGRWFRSPRLQQSQHTSTGASLSPDMALGIQLYLVSTNDIEGAYKWLKHIDDTVPCKIRKPFSGSCWIRSIPQFCPDSENCMMRPGDAEILGHTVDYLHQKGMPPLPHGSLRGYLGTFGSTWLNDYNAHTNKLGYSLHLVAVEAFLLKRMGHTNSEVQIQIEKLNHRDPGNPFFEYLRDGATSHVREIILNACPRDTESLPGKYFQWAWERAMSEQAWKESMLWDCIFMGKLLAKG